MLFRSDTATGQVKLTQDGVDAINAGEDLDTIDLTVTQTNDVAGIVSWGFECGEAGLPGAYTRVAAMRPWIDGVVGPADFPVGLVDPDQGLWYLAPGQGFFFGNPGDEPIMGDWNCDGIDTPGMHRRSDGFVYLRNANTAGVADRSFFFGDPDDIAIAGDWNGDGCDTVSIYRPSEQRFYIVNALGPGRRRRGPAR